MKRLLNRVAPATATFIFSCLIANPALARGGCPSNVDPAVVTMRVISGNVVTDNTRSREEMAAIKSKSGGGSLPGNHHLLGLTATQFKFSFEVKTKIFLLPRGRYCAVAEAVDAEVGYTGFTVYIDRRYKRGTCEHNVIRAHENQHVDIYRDSLARHTAHLRRNLTAAARQLRPATGYSADQATQKVSNRLNNKIKPFIRKMQRAMDDENGRIDTKQSYQATQKKCLNW